MSFIIRINNIFSITIIGIELGIIIIISILYMLINIS